MQQIFIEYAWHIRRISLFDRQQHASFRLGDFEAEHLQTPVAGAKGAFQAQALMLHKLAGEGSEVLGARHALPDGSGFVVTRLSGQIAVGVWRCQVVGGIDGEPVDLTDTTITHNGRTIPGQAGVFKQCVIVAALYPLLLPVSIPGSSDYIITLIS